VVKYAAVVVVAVAVFFEEVERINNEKIEK
jgi:hypothetical protein